MTMLGAYIGIPGSPSSQGLYNSFTAVLGQPTILSSYADDSLPESEWVQDTQWLASQFSASSYSNSAIPDIGIPMASDGENADTSFKNIISGSEDSIFKGIFQAWASAGDKTFDIRPGWEMNGTWFPWSTTPGDAADFVAAFQHIAKLAHQFSGAKIEVVWNPNIGNNGSASIASLYPGNSSVDVIAIDTYGEPVNSDTSPSAASTGTNDYTLQLALNMAKQDGKPFALGETGGVDAAFPANLASVIAQSGVPVAFANIWDSPDGSTDLTWSNKPATAEAWKEAFATIAKSGTAVTYTDAVLTIAPVSGGQAAVDTIKSGFLDQSGVSQVYANSLDTITANNPVSTEQLALGQNNVSLVFIGAGNLTVTGGAGSAVIKAASGANTFTAGTGSLDVTGGPGVDGYIFHANSGTLKIEDFSLTDGSSISADKSLQAAYKTASDGHGGTVLTFGTKGSIDLIGQHAPSAAQIHWI